MEIRINDRFRTRVIKFFDGFKINLKYDAIASTFAFKYFFDPNNAEHKEFSCIGHYHLCELRHNNETLITGQILSIAFNSSNEKQMASIGGYSLPGILEDCEMPIDQTNPTPLIATNLNLEEIVQKVCKPFGIGYVIDPIVKAEMNESYVESTIKPSQNIKSYLSELCSQKNIVISNNNKGQLVFTRIPVSPTSIATLTTAVPVTSMSLSFNGQAMHSHIKVVAQADVDSINGDEFEVRNPYVINTVYRPKIVVQSSKSVIQDVQQSAKNIRAQELKNLKLIIKLDRWEINGKIIRPGNQISVINPEIYLYKKSNWIIEEVELEGDAEKLTSTLTCVLPEVYNNQDPIYLFKGINTHA